MNREKIKSGAPYKHASGSQKRKKQQDIKTSIGKLRKIDSIFNSSSIKHSDLPLVVPIDTKQDEVTVEHTETDNSNANTNIAEPAATNLSAISKTIVLSDDNDGETPDTSPTANSPVHENHDESSLNLHPTDRGNFTENITDSDIKKYIVNHGSCRPSGPFPRDSKGRCFSIDYYFRKTKSGVSLSSFVTRPKWNVYIENRVGFLQTV